MVSQSTLQPSAIVSRFLFYLICQSSFKSFLFLSQSILLDSFNFLPSHGGLVVELWIDNNLPSATVGSNLRQVWCINRSVEETRLQFKL